MTRPSHEIERKFLVAAPPPGGLGKYTRTKIRQGYVAITGQGTEVRVRKQGKCYALTIKEGQGEVRGEEEIEIEADQFEALWPLTRGRRIKKARHEVPHDGLTIEVDVYEGKLEGLTVAEVEFPDEAAAQAFRPPQWFGREVTGESRYGNQNLARRGLPEEAGR